MFSNEVSIAAIVSGGKFIRDWGNGAFKTGKSYGLRILVRESREVNDAATKNHFGRLGKEPKGRMQHFNPFHTLIATSIYFYYYLVSLHVMHEIWIASICVSRISAERIAGVLASP